MDKEDLKELVGVVEAAKPEIEAFISKIQEYGPALKSLVMGITLASCDLRIAAIEKYKTAGFTQAEAILMTLNTAYSMNEAMKRAHIAKK